MSSLATPTRVNRGLIVPGIDTKSPFEKDATAMSYGGLHTPPQSAHERRRPSLQYSALSEAPYSATSSAFAYSQPTTPVHIVAQNNEAFMKAWPESTTPRRQTTLELPCSTPTGQISSHDLHAAFQQHLHPDSMLINDMPGYNHVVQTTNCDVFALQANVPLPAAESWPAPEHLDASFTTNTANTACLGSPLFAMPNDLNSNARSTLAEYNSGTFNVFERSLGISGIANTSGFPSSSGAVYQHPQVVVPSQLSPQDEYGQHNLGHYISPIHEHERLVNSFSSSSSSLEIFDSLGPPSPVDAYFEHSEDEGYLMVKREQPSSPFSHALQGRSHKSRGSIPPKRRSSKRLRGAGKSTCWYANNDCGIEIRCEGKKFSLDGDVKLEIASSSKPHECQFIKEDKLPCGARFDRSEHLKRHMGKHSNERLYPCPLPDCNKSIQRPDNAGDHFKTHLRPKKKGKRNAHFPWPVVRRAIWEGYEDKKKAKKLLDNLRRWVDAGMPDNTSSGRGQQD